MSLGEWLVIAALIGFNAFYVAAEFSAVSVRRSRVRQLADDGDRWAGRLLPHVQDASRLDSYIAACQIGITLSSLLLGAFGQATLTPDLAPFVASWGGLSPAAAVSVAATLVLVGLTMLQVILGELVPKSLALQFPVRLAVLTVAPMEWSLRAFRPFNRVLNGSGNLLLRLFGMQPGAHRHLHRPEEIDLLIAESRDGGLLEPDEHRRLRRALRLGMEPVQRLAMPRTRIQAIPLGAPGDEVVERALAAPFTRFPVYRDDLDHVVGLLHTKDLVSHYVQHGSADGWERLVSPIASVPETLKTDRLLVALRERRTQQAILVDEHGGTDGLVTFDDVLTAMLGEVGDEFKKSHLEAEELPDGRVRLPGRLSVAELDAWLDLPGGGPSTTVGGLVTERLGHIPQPGERVEVAGARFEVERVEENHVIAVLMTPPETPDSEGGEPDGGG